VSEADDPGEGTVCVRARIRGRVQGVFFRDSTRSRARELGLSGWVRNLEDGRVEALFCGGRAAVDAALDFVREGPRHARVEAVEVERASPDEAPPQGFRVVG
jgi:acylphosphatase